MLVAVLSGLVATVLAAENGNYANYGYYSSVYGSNYYADTQQTYYDGYAQAWRYLGWYVDCNGGSNRYYGRSQHSHSGDNNYNIGNNYCQRYLMWAAYVDENYSGGGIGEYAIFDTANGYYDNTACNTHGNGNCKLMDCHDPSSTNWKLIGVFKEASFFGNDAFFEQLFKHEGVCLWNDDSIYEFMSEAREGSWSSGCLSTGLSIGQNSQLYIDLKPTYNGNMTYALYTDYICATEYEGNQYNVESVAAKMGLLYGSYMEQWNNAMEVFKVCQPCRAYNLQNSYKSKSSSSSSSSYRRYWYGSHRRDLTEKESEHEKFERELYSSYYKNNNNGYAASSGWYADDDDSYDPNNGYFRCDDDADYSNVNQCMKFRSHGELEPATWEDLVAATNQGGILQVNVSGIVFGSPFVSKEQDEYLTYVRKQKEAAYEQELKKKAQAAIASAPSGQTMVLIGYFWAGFGGLALFLALVRFVRQMLSSRETKTLLEPLTRNDDAVMA
ncbi:hypothetical protein IV203_030643 [Nitzschia inconspicua]|uniref:Uncharacterized protein n=1 Tax=Nitzschia inconspicua TaxID=303405 RepID=A0A9K3Q2D8_9STRA|nr:hypothetical protein IV203_030643 [Nitzschia inconspicua]